MSNGRLWYWLLLSQVAAAAAVASCGSDANKTVARDGAGNGGAAGDGGAAGPFGGARPDGLGGAAQPGGGDRSDAGDGGNTTAQAGSADTGGTAGAAGATENGGAGAWSNGGAGGEGGGGIDPNVDVGVGCLPPPPQPRLSPAAAGLPQDGLVLWLRADRGVYATQAARVCAWADQSGHRHLFLSNGQMRPLWGASTLGQQPAIEFDGRTKYLSVGGVLDIPATSARTLIAVVQLISTTARFSAVMQGVGNSPGTYVNIDANTFQSAGSREGAYLTNNAYDTTLTTSATPRVHVLTLSTMAPGTAILSALDYRVNGIKQTLTRTPGGLGNGNIENFSAANFTLVGLGASAKMAEALVYDRALNADESIAVETALKTRYGIQ